MLKLKQHSSSFVSAQVKSNTWLRLDMQSKEGIYDWDTYSQDDKKTVTKAYIQFSTTNL